MPLALVAWVWLPAMTTLPALLVLAVALMVGLVSYLLLAHAVHLSEPTSIVRLVVSRLRMRGAQA